MQYHPADELDVEMPLTQRAPARLAYRGKRLRRKVIEYCFFRGSAGKSFGKAFFEFDGLFLERGVCKRAESLFERVYLADNRLGGPKRRGIRITQYAFPKCH